MNEVKISVICNRRSIPHLCSVGVTESTAASGSNPSVFCSAKSTSPINMGGRTGDGGPPVRGMSRSDKGCAGSGEDGKVTSGQEGLQPVVVRDDNFSGRIPLYKK